MQRSKSRIEKMAAAVVGMVEEEEEEARWVLQAAAAARPSRYRGVLSHTYA